jgi:hypothetical protein
MVHEHNLPNKSQSTAFMVSNDPAPIEFWEHPSMPLYVTNLKLGFPQPEQQDGSHEHPCESASSEPHGHAVTVVRMRF